jgi:hypothetical protein
MASFNVIPRRWIQFGLSLFIILTLIVFLSLSRPVVKLIFHPQHEETQVRDVLHAVSPLSAAYNYTAGVETHCVFGRVAQLMVPICTYSSAEDHVVSAFIQRGEYWDPEWVVMIVDLLRQQRESAAESAATTSRNTAVSFIGIGSNVGAYCLAAVHAGHQVSTNQFADFIIAVRCVHNGLSRHQMIICFAALTMSLFTFVTIQQWVCIYLHL